MNLTFPLLRAHRVFHTRCLDESRAVTSQMWERHQVSMPCSGRFETTIFNYTHGGMGLSYVDCKSPLHIDGGPVGPTYYLYLPLDGEVEHRINGHSATCKAGNAVLHAPGQAIHMKATAVRTLIVTLDEMLLANALHSAELPTYSLEQWGSSISLTLPSSRFLMEACLRAAQELNQADAPIMQEGPFSQLRAEVCGHLVAALSNNAPNWKPTRNAWLGICRFDDLTDWMRANIAGPIGLADLVDRSGVSARTIQKAFLQHFGCGPNRFIRNLKLDEAQRRISARPDVNILDLTYELGFGHAGRFAAAYAARFGEYPSATRKRWTD